MAAPKSAPEVEPDYRVRARLARGQFELERELQKIRKRRDLSAL
jgi:hypothetical protein